MKRSLLLSILLVTLSAWWQTGCAQQCKKVTTDYEQVLSQEATLTEQAPQPDMATHVGLGIRFDIINQIAQRLLGQQLDGVLDLATKLPLGGGKVVDIDLKGKPLNLSFARDASCERCFHLTGDLGGSLSVTIPILGKQTIPLGGSLKLIAPIVFEQLANNKIIIKLDTKKFVDYAQNAINLELKQLPETWAQAIKQPLTNKLIAKLTEQLKPIELLSFQSPDFGIKGVQFTPSALAFEPTKKAIFLGFTTNIPGIATDRGIDLNKAITFSDNENLAVALQPELIPTIVTLLMKEGAIPRRYTTDGKADEAGPAHVTLNAFHIGAAQANVGATTTPTTPQDGAQASSSTNPLEINFRAWNLLGAACFWFDALVAGDITIENKVLKVSLQSIKLTDASIAPSFIKNVVNWKTAQFLEETKNLITKTLGEPKIELPGNTTMQLALSSLVKDPQTLVLKSNVLLGTK